MTPRCKFGILTYVGVVNVEHVPGCFMSTVVGGLAAGLPGGRRAGEGGGERRGEEGGGGYAAAAAAVVYIRGEGK